MNAQPDAPTATQATAPARRLHLTRSNVIAILLLAGLFVALVWVVDTNLYVDGMYDPNVQRGPFIGVDWKETFRPAATALIHGDFAHTYATHSMFTPPWMPLLLAPFTFLPDGLSTSVLFVLSFYMYGFVAYRLGAKPLVLAALLISYPALHNAINVNVDAFVALGLLMPPQIGLFFVLIKPQSGVLVAVFWLIEAWRRGGWREASRVFAPVSAAYLLSFALFGFWPMEALNTPVGKYMDASIFPWGVPVALALMALAYRRRDFRYSVAASPFISPYLTMAGWVFPLIGAVNAPLLFALAWVATWVGRVLQVF